MLDSIKYNPTAVQSCKFPISKKRTLVNALDTMDICADKYTVSVDNAQRACSIYPSLVIALPFLALHPRMANKNIFLPTILTGVLAALSFGSFAQKRGDNVFKAKLAGYNDALTNDLTKAKLFLPIDDKILETINKDPDYLYLSKIPTSKSETSLFFDYNFKKHKQNLKDIDEKSKAYTISETPPGREIDKAVTFINDRKDKYNKRIITGMNIVDSAFSMICLGVSLLFNKLARQSKKYSVPLDLAAYISLLPPLVNLFKFSNKSFFSNIDKAAGYMAKEDFLSGEYEDKSSTKTYLDYKNSKDKYKQIIEKQEILTNLKNELINNIEPKEEELSKAEEFQKDFINTLRNKDTVDKLYTQEKEKSFASDFLFNTIGIAALYPFLNRIIRIEKGSNGINNYIGFPLAIASSFALNAIFIRFLNINTDKTV